MNTTAAPLSTVMTYVKDGELKEKVTVNSIRHLDRKQTWSVQIKMLV